MRGSRGKVLEGPTEKGKGSCLRAAEAARADLYNGVAVALH